MNQQKEKKGHFNLKWLLASGGAIITVFSWELIEEALENFIALGISSVIAVLSTFLLVFATQGVKLGIKRLVRFLFPIIKQLIYKEGNDKMTMLKNYWTKVWGNKITGACSAVPFATVIYFAFDFANIGLTILAVVLAFIFAYNIAIFFGGETLKQIQDRLAQGRLSKEEKAKAKAIDAKAKELAIKLQKNQKEQLFAQAKAVVEAEAKKAQAEIKQ